MNPKRRAGLALLAAAGWSAAARAAWTAVPARTVNFPPLADSQRPDFAAFLLLCKTITHFPALDAGFCRRLYRLVLKEPWGPQHVAQVYARARELGVSGKDILDPSQYSDGERWFIRHLLVTLYTGVYYHASGHHAVGYQEALMYQVMGDWGSVPTVCAGGYAFWAKPPAGRRNG